MRRPTLLIASLFTPILLSACLGLPEKTDDETIDVPAATTLADGEDIESGTENPVTTAVMTPGETIDENDEMSETLVGCPEIPDSSVSLENPIPDASAAQLVGLTEAVAATCAESEGWSVRVVAKDGEDYMVTADYRADRVNLTIMDGIVTAINVG